MLGLFPAAGWGHSISSLRPWPSFLSQPSGVTFNAVAESDSRSMKTEQLQQIRPICWFQPGSCACPGWASPPGQALGTRLLGRDDRGHPSISSARASTRMSRDGSPLPLPPSPFPPFCICTLGRKNSAPIPRCSNYTLGRGAFLCTFPPLPPAVGGRGRAGPPWSCGAQPLCRAGWVPASSRAGKGYSLQGASSRQKSSPGPCSQRSLCFSWVCCDGNNY